MKTDPLLLEMPEAQLISVMAATDGSLSMGFSPDLLMQACE